MNIIPKIKDLYLQIIADIQTEYSIIIPLFGKSFLRSVAAVQSSKLKLYYLRLGLLQKNIAPDTADSESVGGTLERFGRMQLNRDPFPAQAGQYIIRVTGEVGAVLRASLTFKSNDDSLNPGVLFVLDNAYTLTTPTSFITVRCLVAGMQGKMEIGNTLTATEPIALADELVTVESVAIEPLEAEDIEDYRKKILESIRLEAQGGATTDYRLWGYDAQGVKQIYPYTSSVGSNQVDIFVEANPADSIDTHGTPSITLLNAVREVIERDPDTTIDILERGRRPTQVIPNMFPVSPKPIDIKITSFAGITTEIQTLLLDALKTEIDKVRPFVDAIDILAEKNDILDVNKIISIILVARPGSSFGAVELKVDSVVESTHTFEAGDIPYLNTVTYV